MILVLAGTAEGRKIVEAIKKKGLPVMASTLTCYGKSLLTKGQDIAVVNGGLEADDLKELLASKQIKLVVDATHPFAVNISRMAQEVCRLAAVKYIRFEREGTGTLPEDERLEWVEDFPEAARRAAEYLQEREGTVFLTVGSNHLEEFCRWIPAQRLVVRVLPQSRVLRKCEDCGLSAGSIAALQGPFSQALNRELFLHYQAAVVVTKDSGQTGGTEEKIAAAKEIGIPVIIVRRPLISYPVIVRDLDELLGLILE